MRKNLLLFLSCIIICLCAYRFGDVAFTGAKIEMMEKVYGSISGMFSPIVYIYDKPAGHNFCQDIGLVIMPVLGTLNQEELRAEEPETGSNETESEHYGEGVGLNGSIPDSEGQDTENTGNTENTGVSGDVSGSEDTQEAQEPDTQTGALAGGFAGLEKQVIINLQKLQDFDYLRQNFYQVDSSTTIGSDLLNVEKLLGQDVTLAEGVEGPQILIYHTHSQEAYADSTPGDPATSVMAVGDYLTQLLQEVYGIQVLHHRGTYDVADHASSYSNAQPEIRRILQENPSIEVVIDLHRDGVPETTHLVTEINGKPTAQIMFFNGLSRTTSTGNLTYLSNPYIENNLALSFQMQLSANEYFPGLTRRIYLKGYRYNMHLCPKSMLIEVGAQTNTFAEAKNAMEPLAFILANVLKQ